MYIYVERRHGCLHFFIGCLFLFALGMLYTLYNSTIDMKDMIASKFNDHDAVVESVTPEEMARFKTLKIRSNFNDKQLREAIAALKELEFPFDRPFRQNRNCITALETNRIGIKDEFKVVFNYTRDGDLKDVDYQAYDKETIYNMGNPKLTLKNQVITDAKIKLVDEKIKNRIVKDYQGKYNRVEVASRDIYLGINQIYYKANLICKNTTGVEDNRVIDGSINN